MRCIVTGGSGFIGGHLARRLQQMQHQVLVVDKVWQPNSGLAGVAVEICDLSLLTDVFKSFNPDIVFHLAGVADARAVLAYPVESIHINIVGTSCVLEAARQAEVKRVILASSSWVYNAMPVGLIDENEAFLPSGGGHIYTSTMIARELLAHDFHRLYHLPFTLLRYSPVYGPGMWPGLALSSFIQAAQAGGPLVIFGDGQDSRAFIYVDDLINAFIAALQTVASNQVYNIEGPRSITINELATHVSDLFGGIKIVHRAESTRRGELHYSGRTISCEKIRQDLNWMPHVDIDEGILHVLKELGIPIRPV